MQSGNENAFAISDRRSSIAEIQEQSQRFSNVLFPISLFDTVPSLFLLLNENRQIVFANSVVKNILDEEELSAVLGLRPGEALRCLYADRNEHGCGTSEFCAQCGANRAIRESLTGLNDSQECNMLRLNSNGETQALDLQVWATPFEFEGKRYSAFSIMDTSHEKRRRVLERIFFHDIMNIAGGIQNYIEYLVFRNTDVGMTELNTIHRYARKLVEEIEAQRELGAAEHNELTVHPSEFDALDLLEHTVSMYREHDSARNKTIRTTPDSERITIFSDTVLLGRVLGNMLKNALEASRDGQEVIAGCIRTGDRVEFRVNNSLYIPSEIQTRIFQRSFSTKGADRGLGTYSVKLLVERYLKGDVRFDSTDGEGTTFYVRLPLRLPVPGPKS